MFRERVLVNLCLGAALSGLSLLVPRPLDAALSCKTCDDWTCVGGADACMPSAQTMPAAWEDQRRAGVMLVTNWLLGVGKQWSRCSGTLLNNLDQDYLIVTALHCLDENGDGTVSSNERTAYAMKTRVYYGYGVSSPVGEVWSSTVTLLRSGVDVGIAGDVVLLQATGPNPAQEGEVALAGWNKNMGPLLSSAYGIGNPCGDRQKFLYSSEPQAEFLWDPDDVMVIMSRVEQGGVQGGFSGGGLFTGDGQQYVGPIKGYVSSPLGTSCDPDMVMEVGVPFFPAYIVGGMLMGYATADSMPTVRLGPLATPGGTIGAGETREYSGWPEVLVQPEFWAQFGSEVRIYTQP